MPVTITNNNNNNNLKLAVNKQPNNKNDKEIQIQRVSTTTATTTPIPSISNEQPSITNNINNTTNKIKLSQSTPINNIQTTNQSDFSKSSNFIEPSSPVVKPTPANVSNTIESVNNKTMSVNNSNIHTIAATLAASTTPTLSEPIVAKAKIQQQNAQMNTKILATLNSKLLHQQQQQHQQKQIVPQFHYPNGKPDEKQFKDDPDTMKLVSAEFRLQKEAKVYKETFADIMKIIGLPKFWKILLFRALTLNTKLNYVTYTTFEQVWTK